MVSPNLVEQQFACEHTTRVVGEKLKQLELVGSENHGNPAASRTHAHKIDLAIRKPKDRDACRFTLSANRSLNAGGKLSWAKRLGNVVVRTQPQKQHLIGNLADCAQHYDWRLAGDALKGVAKLAPGYPWKNQVKDHGKRSFADEQVEPGLTVAGNNNGVVLFDEDSAEHFLYPGVVFNNQDGAKLRRRHI